MNIINENSKKTPVSAEGDVVVCGGGPAGVAAAVSSARAGAKTILIESQGCLGGTWTSGCLAWILDHENKNGLMQEIFERLELMEGRAIINSVPTNAFDVEKMKLLLETLCVECGVQIHLHTLLAGAGRSGSRLTHALIESKSGRQAVAGKIFVDCTGDGNLAAHAGCGFDMGRPETGKTQPMSMLALVAGLDREKIKPYFRYAHDAPRGEPKNRLREEMERAGLSPSYAKPTLFWIRDDLFFLMANHEYEVFGTNAADITTATIAGRQEIHTLVNNLRNLGGIWSNLYIVATSAHIGVREGRRIHGRYCVTMDDMANGKRHPDAVCTVTFGADVHSTDKSKGKAVERPPVKTCPYDIPVRALIAKDIEGLMIAGRCISGDFIAHSSYRVTGNAVAMGETAGRIAAKAVKTGHMPHEI